MVRVILAVFATVQSQVGPIEAGVGSERLDGAQIEHEPAAARFEDRIECMRRRGRHDDHRAVRRKVERVPVCRRAHRQTVPATRRRVEELPRARPKLQPLSAQQLARELLDVFESTPREHVESSRCLASKHDAYPAPSARRASQPAQQNQRSVLAFNGDDALDRADLMHL